MSNFTDENNVESEPILMRVLWSILFMVIWSIAETVIFIIFIVQTLFWFFAGAPNENLQAVGKKTAAFMRDVVKYLSYATNEKPFPFSSWPDEDEV